MPTVVVCTDGSLEASAPCTGMLRDAGFEVRFEVDEPFATGQCEDGRTIDVLRGAAAVMAWGEPYTARVFAALPDLRVVARIGVGFDQVDLAAATDHDVVVTITPNANHEAVAEHVLALMLALARRIAVNDRLMRAGGWPGDTLVLPLRGRCLGIVGLGRIGKSLATRAVGLKMTVVATDIQPDEAFARSHGIALVDLETLLAESDYVSLHCPLNDQTRGLMDADRIARMKPDAALINTSRGGIVEETALVAALRRGHLAGAGLDVFARQPTDAGHPLLQLDNVVACPHIAGNDTAAMRDMGIEAARCIIDLHQGRWPREAVLNPQLADRWQW